MSGGYIMLPGDVKPHVVAAVFDLETRINGAEQGQMQVRANVIVYQRVVLYRVVTERAVALRHGLLLPVLSYHPRLCGGDSRNGVWFHKIIQPNHWHHSIPISCICWNTVSGPRILNTLTKYLGHTLCWFDNFTSLIRLSVFSL